MQTWPPGYDRRVLMSVDSTMAEATRVAKDVAGPTWILAHEQTAARGRRGRQWRNPPGNFACTLILRPTGELSDAALRSFVASLALRDAFVEVTKQPSCFALKWPNDVLLNGGKVAGILLESVMVAGQMHLAIGIGVNLQAAPGAEDVEEGAVPPVSLRSETGVDVSPEKFLEHLAIAYAKLEAQFQTFGFEPIRTAWLQHAARLGTRITARTTRDVLTGTFVDVDNQGQLVLDTGATQLRIPAGDVFF